MAVVVRLSRRGTRNRPYYHIVAADKRFPRDGRYLERLGVYDPMGETQLAINEERAQHWIKVGARLSDTVQKLFKRAGVFNATPAAAA